MSGSDVLWNRWVKGGLVFALAVAGVLVIGFAIASMRGDVAHEGEALSEYVDGVLHGDEDAVAARMCPGTWEQVRHLEGGFEEARDTTFAAFPGELEEVSRRRGGDDRAVLDLRFESQDWTLFDLPVARFNGETRWCPPAPDRLLGSPREAP